MRHAQRGITFIGLVFTAFMVAVVGVVVVQAVPAFLEFNTIVKAANRAASGATVAEVRDLFDKSAQIDGIKSLQGKDLQVSKVNDKVVVEFSYAREIHLAGPVYLLLKYSGRSD